MIPYLLCFSLLVSDLSATAAPGISESWFDLLRMVFPRLERDANSPTAALARETVALRSLSGEEETGALEGEYPVSVFESLEIRSQGRRVLLSLIPLGEDATVLAAFSLEPSVQLLDAVDVRSDRVTSFWSSGAAFALAENTQGFAVSNSHHNAGQNYESIELIHIANGRIESIGGSIPILNNRGCGAYFDESIAIRTAPDAGRRYRRIHVNVKLDLQPEPGEMDCKQRTRRQVKEYHASYRWDPGKSGFTVVSSQLEQLAVFNEKQF